MQVRSSTFGRSARRAVRARRCAAGWVSTAFNRSPIVPVPDEVARAARAASRARAARNAPSRTATDRDSLATTDTGGLHRACQVGSTTPMQIIRRAVMLGMKKYSPPRISTNCGRRSAKNGGLPVAGSAAITNLASSP